MEIVLFLVFFCVFKKRVEILKWFPVLKRRYAKIFL